MSLGALTIGGCATLTSYRLYSGDRPLNDLAVIFWDGSSTPRFEGVNGQALPQGKLAGNRAELLPGRYVFTLRPTGYRAGGDFSGLIELPLTLEAGRCYMLKQDVLGTEREYTYKGIKVTSYLSEPYLFEIGRTDKALCGNREPFTVLPNATPR